MTLFQTKILKPLKSCQMPTLKAAYKYQTDSLAKVLGQGFGLVLYS
jgi:hypothetical protein